MFDIVVKTDKGKLVAKERITLYECALGKARDNRIVLRGWRIAGHHAEIRQTPKGIFVEDKSRGAGTLVNGERVESYGPLRSHDVINIGSYQINVGQVAEEKPATEEAAKQQPVKPKAEEPAKSSSFFSRDKEKEEAEEEEPMLKTMLGVRPHSGVQSDETIFKQERYMWRNRVHQDLLRKMDVRRTDVGAMDEETLRENVKGLIKETIDGLGDKLPDNINQLQLAKDVLNEAVGLGPLEDLLADDAVTEVMVNKYDDIYIEKSGKLQKSKVTFSSDDAVMSAIERIISPLGRRIDESSPMVDGRLKDGSRVNAIIPPLALRGPCITIRKFAKTKLTSQDLINYGAISQPMVEFLEMAVTQRKNVIVSGGTGSGKTTLLNVLSNYIPPGERIITVEDAAELKLTQPHLVSLEARPPNLEGRGAVTIRDLVKNCLRMRPDRIVVGECRGGEALDMLQAMNTGHDGSMTTAHANTPRDLISRLEVMVMMSGLDLPVQAIREQVSSAVDIVVQQTRFSDGSRKIVDLSEVTGMESGVIQLQQIFRFVQQGFDANGRVKGHFEATGRIPEFYEDLRARGLPVNMSIFD